jgi:twitching motility protein PilT
MSVSSEKTKGIDRLFLRILDLGGSNLHLKRGRAPTIRINGELREINHPPLTSDQLFDLCLPLLDDRHSLELQQCGGTDFAHVIQRDELTLRYRVNLFQQLGTLAMVAQAIEPKIPALDSLHLPPQLVNLCRLDQGMVLVAGMTGTGKSTTIAAMLNWINHHYRKHILTIEDPVEFVFEDRMALVNQREIGESVKDFATAMKHAVREDPDVILVGEMRDAESFETALHAAETGHLVFGTVHASAAATTIGRILDLFPQGMHKAIRSSMAFNIRAILAQKLIPTVLPETPRVPIIEIMLFNATVRKLILQGDDDKLEGAINLGRNEGMQRFDDSLYDFVERGVIGHEEAILAATNADAFKMRLKGVEVKSSGLL